MFFSEWLQQQMGERDLSQADLARKTGLSTAAISNLINQMRKKPAPETLKLIAKALGLPQRQVFEAAGFIDPDPDPTPTLEEVNHKLSQLPIWQQQIVLNFVDSLLNEGGSIDPAPQMAPSHPE